MSLGNVFKLMALREAAASVAVDHAETCGCVSCRAAKGDADALAELIIAQARYSEQRPNASPDSGALAPIAPDRPMRDSQP